MRLNVSKNYLQNRVLIGQGSQSGIIRKSQEIEMTEKESEMISFELICFFAEKNLCVS